VNKKAEMEKLNLEYSMLPAKSREWKLSRNFVKGEGPLNAKVMVIGQAPGRNEDIQKRPFIGTSGKFLDKLINLAGLDRKAIYICSVVQFFPPETRVPTKEEIELCKRFLFRQIDILNPRLVILLGSVACRTVLGVEKVSQERGKIIKRHRRNYFISMHPAAAVRIRTKMPLMEGDFKNLKRILLNI
jgi:uracil-DNA glycosylase family 4